MPIKASDIQKKLPDGGKKNCKECGFPTCFAFAMKLAGGGISVDKCPYLSLDVREELAEAVAPPINLVTFGKGEYSLSVGEEEVMFRHEKTFYHQPGIAIYISDKENDDEVEAKVKKLQELQFERVGFKLRADVIALKYESGDRDRYLELTKKIAEYGYPVILICDDVKLLFEARDSIVDWKPLLYSINKDNLEEFIPLLLNKPSPVVVKGKGLDEVVELTTKLKNLKIKEVILDTQPENLTQAIQDYTLIRRAALKFNFRALGFPIISLLPLTIKCKKEAALLASALVIKYASVIVLNDFDKETLFPLLILRQNIYTDPRVPLAVEEKVYEIGSPDENSPVLLTTNFALTYFAVSGEIEGSKVPSYLCVKGADGLCILAAWSTGKFIGETIAPFIKKSGIEDKVKNKRLIIPGLAARIKGEIEDELPGWEIIVGPKAAEDIPSYLPKLVEKWKM